MKADELTALATLAAVVVAMVAAVIAGYSRRGQSIELITTIRAQWEALVDDWATSVLLHASDPDWYYTQASVAERSRIRDLMDSVRDETTDLRARVSMLRAETKSVRRVARFLAYVADAVIRGRLSVRDAYAVLGPDIARHRTFVYWLAGRSSIRDGSVPMPNDEWFALIDQVQENHFYDEQDAIVMLANLLSSESSRRGDTYPHLVGALARELRPLFDSGAMRSTVWRVCLHRGSLWRFPGLYLRLRRVTRPPRSAARRPDAGLIDTKDKGYFKRGLRTKDRADTTLSTQQPFELY